MNTNKSCENIHFFFNEKEKEKEKDDDKILRPVSEGFQKPGDGSRPKKGF